MNGKAEALTEQVSFSLRGRNPDVLTCFANLSNDAHLDFAFAVFVAGLAVVILV